MIYKEKNIPWNFNDLSGLRFGRLTVKYLKFKKNKRSMWYCKCDCGNYKIVPTDRLKSGNTKSCGCLHKENVSKKFKKHGMTGTRFYNCWTRIKGRCYNINNNKYHRYGKRGINVCKRWHKFENFKEDMYESYLINIKKYGIKNTTIDRINNDKNYCKSNCRWADNKTQSNNRSNNNLIKYNNKIKNLSQWANELNMDKNTLRARIFIYNWSIKKSFETPVKS